MQHNIGVIINYCTNDHKFIGPSIRQIAKFSENIVVTYSDHFYTGQPENKQLIQQTIKENLKAKFIEMKYSLVKPPIPEFICQLLPRTGNIRPLYGPHYWACMSRFVGYQSIPKGVDYLLFLDADEIVDGDRFINWLNAFDYESYQSLLFSCYSYFRDPKYQATTIEGCGLLTRNTKIDKKIFLSHNDRHNIYHKLPGLKKDAVMGLDNKPMFHHYAWARTKEGMLRKVATWGHSQERDWKSIVNNEFSHSFNGTDFLRHYHYKTVKPFVDFTKNKQ